MAEAIAFKPPGSSPPRIPTKDCPLSQRFEPHAAHPWEKKPGWFFNCEGVLPLDEQPPCQWYISPEQPECGQAAPTKIRIKTKLLDARVDVCVYHKGQYDNVAALRRATATQPEHQQHRRAS